MTERAGAITFKGQPLTLVGITPQVGEPAPNVTLLAHDLSEVPLSDALGKVGILVTVPSLDTPVCDTEVRKFNEKAAELGDQVIVGVVSMDLPFAQKRWCGAAGIENVITLSDHRDAALGKAYGLLIKELRLLARAVFVMDRQGIVRYVEIVKEMTEEPNYEAALAAAKALL